MKFFGVFILRHEPKKKPGIENWIFLIQKKSLTVLYSEMIHAPMTRRSSGKILEMTMTANVGQVPYNEYQKKISLMLLNGINSFIIYINRPLPVKGLNETLIQNNPLPTFESKDIQLQFSKFIIDCSSFLMRFQQSESL